MSEEQNTPWSGDEDFDAEKAKTLVKNLREDIAKLKADKQTLANERDSALADVETAEAEFGTLKTQYDELQANFDAQVNEVNNLSSLRTKENMLIEAGLPRDYTKFVIGDTEDEWSEAVKNLIELRGESKQEDAQERRPDPAQAATPDYDEKALLAAQLFGD